MPRDLEVWGSRAADSRGSSKLGGAARQDLEDWLQAERELLEEYKKIGPVREATAP